MHSFHALIKEANGFSASETELQKRNRSYTMNPMKMGTKPDGFERKGQAWFVATELQSDLVVEVGDMSFHLHKFPLLSRSGRLNRLVFESRDTQKDHIKLLDMPGGPEAFELAAKFCYGVAVDLTASNIASLRCAAEYLEMTEDLEEGNLISKTEAFLSFVVLASWKDSITVFQSCESLKPWSENLQIVRRCCESIAWKACTDPRGISWSFTGPGGTDHRNDDSPLWNGLKNDLKKVPQDWWFEDVSVLCEEYFVKVISAIRAKGMRPDLIANAVVQYALKWIPGLGSGQNFGEDGGDSGLEGFQTNGENGKGEITVSRSKTRTILESVVSILPPQKDSASCSFLLRLLRMANMLNANVMCRKELERKVALQLEQATLADLLIPSFNLTSETLFDVDLVHRVVQNFLVQEQTVPGSPATGMMMQMMGSERGVYDHGLSRGHVVASQNAKTKVAKLIDSYLAEVARDSNLSVIKFQELAEELPEHTRACDDGLYRAIDTYLKAHPGTTEAERKRLCRLMDCQKLSLDACMHAAQNERLPLRVVVQVLFCEQVKLRNAMTGSALSAQQQRPHGGYNNYDSPIAGDGEYSPSVALNGELANGGGGGLSATHRDIKGLKQDVEKIKAKFTALQADYATLQRAFDSVSRGGGGGTATRRTSMSSNNGGGGGGGGGLSFPWSGGWKKLVRAPAQIFHNSRLSMDESNISAAGISGAAMPTPSPSQPRRQRRWRNSIS